MKNDRLRRFSWILAATMVVAVLPSCGLISSYVSDLLGSDDDQDVPPGGGGPSAACDLAVTPTSLAFDCDLAVTSLVATVANLGNQSFSWSVDVSACTSLIQVVPSSGTLAPGASQNVTVSVVDCTLVANIVNCSIVFASNCGASGTDTSSVGVTILPAPPVFGEGTLAVGRALHTSNLLPTNPVVDHGPEVLIAGGFDTPTSSTDSLELITPLDSPDGVPLFPVLSSPRMGHSSVLQTQTGNDEVYFIGGDDNSGGVVNMGTPSTVDTIDVYDANFSDFSPSGGVPMAGPHGFGNASALMSSGKVLITGGMDGIGDAANTAEVFDPVTAPNTPTSMSTGSMLEPRMEHTANYVMTSTTGAVLVGGGESNGGMALYYELYNPNTGLFSQSSAMMVPRGGHTATQLLDGRVLLAGGFGDIVNAMPYAEIYDPMTQSATPAADMNAAREFHAANLVPDIGSGQGGVVVTGGDDPSGTALNSVEFYDPLLDEWTACASLMVARTGHTSELVPLAGGSGYALVVVGGVDATSPVIGNVLGDTEIYDPSTCGMSPSTATKGGGGAVAALSLLDPENELAGRIVTRNVSIPYTLYHPEGRPQLVYIEWSADQGRTWHSATKGRGSERLTVATARPEGSRHRFVWDSWTDLPGFTGLVAVRIRTYNGLLSEGERIHIIVDNP